MQQENRHCSCFEHDPSMKLSYDYDQTLAQALSNLPPRSAENSITLALCRDRDLSQPKEKNLGVRNFLSSFIDATPFRAMGPNSSVSLSLAPSSVFVYHCNFQDFVN
jgi:hypothetical protein